MIVLDGRTVIVTGAAQGLGRAMSLGLLTAGANVVAADLSSNPAFSELQGLAEAAGARRRLVSVGGDVTDPAQCKAIVDAGLRAFGAVDGLINNAGLGMNGITAKVISDPKLFHQLAPEQWRAVMRVNVDGPFMMAHAASAPMLARGSGKIVNILTSRATMVLRGFSPYGPSKAAMEAATAIWAQDLAGSGITVNALLPGGAADTSMIPAEEDIDRAKLIRPDAMVEPIRWLMSSHSDGVTAKRFIATEWREDLPPERIAAELAREAGWAGSV
jgi:3-oxoacyl-[acyl-carrier protein] reductase